MAKLRFSVSADGHQVKIEGEGFKGKRCFDASKEYERAIFGDAEKMVEVKEESVEVVETESELEYE